MLWRSFMAMRNVFLGLTSGFLAGIARRDGARPVGVQKAQACLHRARGRHASVCVAGPVHGFWELAGSLLRSW